MSDQHHDGCPVAPSRADVTTCPAAEPTPASREGLKRRHLLQGAGLAAGGVAVGLGGGAAARASAATGSDPADPAQRSFAFHGAHQSGITVDRQPRASYVALDVTTASRAGLVDLFRTLTSRARFLTTGGTPRQLGISAPPADSGVLGPDVVPSGLTITLGVGSTLFDKRFGLSAKRPRRLRPMDTFPDDDLDPSRCHGDLLLTVAGDADDVVLHALRDLLRHTRGAVAPRWKIDAFSSPPRPEGTPRNLLGFKDGTANPVPDEYDRLVWVPAGGAEPAWTAGGAYQVVRVIRMLVEFWDRVTISEQERMIGRRRDTGAPLSGSVEVDTPSYSDDPNGGTTPLDAHIRMANPRTPSTDRSRILRRSYNYDRGIDVNGNLDMGLVFGCFCNDLDSQFVAVQKRLAGEPLVDYISPVGGGYFFALPGVQNSTDWYGRSLLG